MKIYEAEIGPFWVGDQPGTPATVEIEDGDLSAFPNATVKLRKPDGTAQTLTGIATVADETISIDLSGNYFTAPGIWSAQLVLTGPGKQETLPPVQFVVEEEDGWLDLYTIRSEWRDAPDDDVSVYRLLQVAKTQVLEYGPSLGTPAADVPGVTFTWDDPELPSVPEGWTEDPDNPGFFFAPETPVPRPPEHFIQAQRMQARNIWNGAKTDPAGMIGDNGQAIRPYPMDNIVKGIIRPKRAIPIFGRA